MNDEAISRDDEDDDSTRSIELIVSIKTPHHNANNNLYGLHFF